MSGILGLLADAEKLTPDQRNQSVKDGVLPPDLANMINASVKDLNQTQPQPTDNKSISDDVMAQADQTLDPKNEILDKIDILKDDIGKIQGAIHAGEVKPYVGIPLLEKKIGELNKLESLIKPPQNLQQPVNANPQPGMQPTQPPQSLNAQQAPSQGLNALQSNLPQQMAYGGIVNLASGSYIDPDDEDDEDEQRAFEEQIYNMPMGEGLGSAIMARADTKKPAFSSFTQAQKTATPTGRESNVPQGGIYDIINDKAKKYNLPPELMHRIAKAESNYDPNASNKNSNAKGLYQFIDTTWTSMGGKKGEQFDPEMNTELGAKYIRQNADYLKNKLGRNPTYSEIYGAHFFGPHGAASLLSKADPDMPIEQGLATFESKKRIKTIMNQNPNLRGKTVGDVFGDFANKTGQGIVSLAVGGHIKRFFAGNKISDENMQEINDVGGQLDTANTAIQGLQSFPNRTRMLIPNYNDKVQEAIKNRDALNTQYQTLMSKYGVDKPAIGYQTNMAPTSLKPNPVVQALSTQNKPNITALSPDLQAQEDVYNKTDYFKRNKQKTPDYNEDVPYSPNAASKSLEEEVAQEKPKSSMDNFMDYINQSREDLKKNHETDKYMGLLMAGLGMMGGTSQFAGANIGKGAMMGVQHFADLQKQQAAERANLDKLQGYGVRSQMSADLAREFRPTKEEKERQFNEQMDLKRSTQQNLDEERLNKRLLGRQSQIENNVKNLLKMDTIGNINDPDVIGKYNAAVSRALANDSLYNNYYKQLYGTEYNIPNIGELSGLPKIKVVNGKTYELQENNKYKEK